MTALYIASYKDRIEVVQILLAYGANVKDKNNVSTTYYIMMK